MAFMFLRLDNISGEASDAEHKDQIEIHDWSWSLDNTASFSIKEEKEKAAATVVHLLTVDKFVDNATVPLVQYCAQGTHIPTGSLACRKNTGDRGDSDTFWEIQLTDIKVVSVKWAGAGPAEHGIPEAVELSFLEFEIHYKVQSNDGPMLAEKADVKGKRGFHWNIPKDKVVKGGPASS
jgi:type VI secretion system secreted protein Hcp